MIVVAADDMSGAAEIAGAAFAHGMTAEVQTEFNPAASADLISFDANSRSNPSEQAATRWTHITKQILDAQSDCVFKKIDSVLRGSVLAELKSMLAVGPWKRALLIPANPSRNRIIRHGTYFIHDRLLDQTAFALDPEHPVKCSSVFELLGTQSGDPVCSLGQSDDLPGHGIAVPDVETLSDIAYFVDQVDETTLPVGAADFFNVLLLDNFRNHVRNESVEHPIPVRGSEMRRTLFVCGSAAAWQNVRREQCSALGIPVLLVHPGADIDGAILKESGAAMLAIRQNAAKVPPQALVRLLAESVNRLLQSHAIRRLCVEGGATAAAIVRKMGWSQLTVSHQYAPGIVALRAIDQQDLELVVKPGSYDWPEMIWPGD